MLYVKCDKSMYHVSEPCDKKFVKKVSLVTLKNGCRNPHYYSKLWLHLNCLDLILTLGRPRLKISNFRSKTFKNFSKKSKISGNFDLKITDR